MKKAQRKLIPAIAMLLVSATMLSSASFAWFTMNSTVTAEGMKVEAVSPSNLLIANNASGTGAAATASSVIDGQLKLQPASTTALTATPSFFRVKEAEGIKYDNAAAAVGTVFEAVPTDAIVSTKENSQSGTDNVVKHSFWIKDGGNEGGSKTDLHVTTISVADGQGNAAISDSLRVGVVCGQNGFIYAPLTGSTSVTSQCIKTAGTVASVNGGVLKNDSSQAISVETQVQREPTVSDVLADTVSNQTWTKVDIYIWYEGSDAECHSQNAETVDKLNISVGFACKQ